MLDEIAARDRSLADAQANLERRVLERTAELDAVNKELEAFSYSVSHDLRAPLRHIAGFANMLERRSGPSLDEQSRGYLKTIDGAAKRMGQLIDDLLAFSRISRNQMAPKRVSLDALVAEARREVMRDGNPSIEWQIDRLPEVEGDQAMLRQVVLNLLANAAKYSSTRQPARIHVGVQSQSNGEVVVFVRDNGVGFDMQYVHKLFGVFQRLHSSDDFEGTGIGLANVRRIIHRHGGRVWAEGKVDEGATFYFALPKDLPAA
jgi:light-regulated signal transduction histidine kinase (bacteriophytochrome)